MKAEENPHALNSAAAALNELGELVADSVNNHCGISWLAC